ncbi:Uncharacterised protein [Mycobacterium tuberculosis]|nr:Uncharacterised protein [Mycobacterium tuberculosis]
MPIPPPIWPITRQRPTRRRAKIGLGRWWPRNGPRRFRCRLPSGDYGFSTSYSDPLRSTTWRWRCGCAGISIPRRWARRSPMSWAATKAYGRCFRRSTGSLGSWSSKRGGQILAATSSMPPHGRLTGCNGPSRRRRATASIWQPRYLCGRGFSGSPTTNMCWWRLHTISPPTAGRWLR